MNVLERSNILIGFKGTYFPAVLLRSNELLWAVSQNVSKLQGNLKWPGATIASIHPCIPIVQK